MSTPSAENEFYQAPKNGFRTFVIIWLTQSISVIGSALTYFATTIWLTQVLYPKPEQKAQLAFALSAMGVVWGVTHILSMPFAGSWADRHDRKRTMIGCDALNGLLSVALALLIVTGGLNLWLLLLVTVFSTVVGDFHGSSFDTSYAMLVTEKQLPRANGMMQTTWSFSNIVSPAMAAALISLPALARQDLLSGGLGALLARVSDGTVVAISVDALTFFVAALVPLFLFVPSPHRAQAAGGAKSRKTVWADVQEGAVYIWRRRPMLWLLVLFTIGNLMGSFMSTLRPMLVKFNLAADWTLLGFTYETALAMISSGIGIGGLIGGLIISAWGGLKHHRVYGAIVPMIGVGLMQMLFGFSPWLWPAVIVSAIWSGLVPFMNSHSQAIWQGQTPRELQGRVFAVRRVIAQFTYPIGTALAGAAGGLFNPGLVVAVTGILLVLFCVVQALNPELRKVEDKAYLDRLAGQAALSTAPVGADSAD